MTVVLTQACLYLLIIYLIDTYAFSSSLENEKSNSYYNMSC